MSDHSAIEWTDATWNPTTGCTKVSPACANCYIERTPPFRIHGRKFVNGHIPLVIHEDRLGHPQRWKKPCRVFVNSLSDLFHPDVPDQFIAEVWRTMHTIRRHTYQVLTKRAERMAALVPRLVETFGVLPNVWLGVSVENQHFADERIPYLLRTPAAVRFLSCEPLLGPLAIRDHLISGKDPARCANCGRGHGFTRCPNYGSIALTDTRSPQCDTFKRQNFDIAWVIVGFESGRRRRSPNAEWARSVRDQCIGAGVNFFFKQWGGPTPKSGGRELDGRTWDEFPDSRPSEAARRNHELCP